MGARQSKPPLDIAEFRKLPTPSDRYDIPEVPQKRRVTDFKFTVTFAVAFGILAIFLIYASAYADIRRFTHGCDPCGNICGVKNDPIDGVSCSGKDQSNYPRLKYRRIDSHFEHEEEFIPEKCVLECDSGSVEIFNRCFPTNDERAQGSSASEQFKVVLKKISSDLQKSAGQIVALCFIGLGSCLVMLLLFRFFAAVVVWIILIGSFIGLVVLAGVFWYFDGIQDTQRSGGPRVLAIVFTIIAIIYLALMIFLFKRIKLVIRLFKEAMKVVFGIPLILLEPLLTFIASAVLVVCFVCVTIKISTSGTLERTGADFYEYVPNFGMLVAIWFNVIMTIWMAQFIVGCQHMVVSGAVSAYFFTRDKTSLGSPIYNSFYNLVRYHLGTVALGSLIITIIAIIKALIRSVVDNKQCRFVMDCCLGAIEDFLKYLSKNAYIQTAMHGQPFFVSGKRAVRLLAANALSAIAINSIGDFVMFMAKMVIVLFTCLIGVAMYDETIEFYFISIIVAVVITAILADCFFAVFETAIDTIFLCFCEDSSLNDGTIRPYYMPVELMKYVEEAKATVKK